MAYGIGWRALTNESLHDKRPVVYDALAAGDAWLGRLVHPLGTLRWRLPTPESRRGHRLRRELDTAIDSLAAERRNGFEGDDLLRDWVRSNDELGGTDADLRGSLKAFFGAENLHTHLAWTFYLLAQNPEVEAKLHEELDTVLDGRPPTPDDLEALEYTRHVVTESLRIYPSVPAFFRGIRGDGLRLGDDTVPSGSLLGFSPWTIQRDARWWPDPLRFDPDRWGAGPRTAAALRLLPVRGRAVSLPGHRQVGEGGPARPRDAGPALADADPGRRAGADPDGHVGAAPTRRDADDHRAAVVWWMAARW